MIIQQRLQQETFLPDFKRQRPAVAHLYACGWRRVSIWKELKTARPAITNAAEVGGQVLLSSAGQCKPAAAAAAAEAGMTVMCDGHQWNAADSNLMLYREVRKFTTYS